MLSLGSIAHNSTNSEMGSNTNNVTPSDTSPECTGPPDPGPNPNWTGPRGTVRSPGALLPSLWSLLMLRSMMSGCACVSYHPYPTCSLPSPSTIHCFVFGLQEVFVYASMTGKMVVTAQEPSQLLINSTLWELENGSNEVNQLS